MNKLDKVKLNESFLHSVKESYGYVHPDLLKEYARSLWNNVEEPENCHNDKPFEQLYAYLVYAYNGDFDTVRYLRKNRSLSGSKGILGILAEQHLPPCKNIWKQRKQKSGHFCYKVGPRRFAYEKNWVSQQTSKGADVLKKLNQKRESDLCVIVGNGSSLKKADTSLLNGHDVIMSNNTFQSEELFQYATYYTVVNYLVAEQGSHWINNINHAHKVFPVWLSYCLLPDAKTSYVNSSAQAKFCMEAKDIISCRHTVSFFNLQLAYILGYTTVILIGFDHSYKQPKNTREGDVIVTQDKDENHFIDSYFQGKKWQGADVHKMEEMYRLAKNAYLQDKRTIINATDGGELELFPRMPLDVALRTT